MSHPITIPTSITPVRKPNETKVVKHNSKVFTSTARKEHKDQIRLNSHQGSPAMSTSSTRSGHMSPSPTPSPIPTDAKDQTDSVADSTAVPSPGLGPRPSKLRNNQPSNTGPRSQSFSHTPSYNSYHRGHSGRGYFRNVIGVHYNVGNDQNIPRETNDSSSRPGSNNSNRVASLTGSNLRSGSTSRGGRRGGFNNRYPNRPQLLPNGAATFPRFPGAPFMVPMAYPYYTGAYPMTIAQQPSTTMLVPDPSCRCAECISYFSTAINTGYYPTQLSLGPQINQVQTMGSQLPSENAFRPLVPVGPYMQAPIPSTPYLPDYAAYAQQQALLYHHQQQQLNMASVAGQVSSQPRNGNATSAPEPKNELTPIEAPGLVPAAQHGDGFYSMASQQPFYILPAGPLNPPGNFVGDSLHGVQQSFNTQVNNGQGNGSSNNTLSYAIMNDRVIQNTPSPQQSQHKR